MPQCCVPRCTSNAPKKLAFPSFCFPLNEELKRQWLQNIDRADFQPSKFARVCALHFEEKLLYKGFRMPTREGGEVFHTNKRVRLVNGAIPTIFPNAPIYLPTELPKENRKKQIEEGVLEADEISTENIINHIAELNQSSENRKFCPSGDEEMEEALSTDSEDPLALLETTIKTNLDELEENVYVDCEGLNLMDTGFPESPQKSVRNEVSENQDNSESENTQNIKTESGNRVLDEIDKIRVSVMKIRDAQQFHRISLCALNKNSTQIMRNENEIISKLNLVADSSMKTNELLQSLISLLKPPVTESKPIEKNPSFQCPNFPIASVTDLESFNSKLTQAQYMDQMVSRMHTFKSDTVSNTIKNIFKRTFEYKLLKKYSWTGQSTVKKNKTKLIFSELTGIIHLIANVQNYDRPEIALNEAKKEIQKFLQKYKEY